MVCPFSRVNSSLTVRVSPLLGVAFLVFSSSALILASSRTRLRSAAIWVSTRVTSASIA